jgi:hypothetical protein
VTKGNLPLTMAALSQAPVIAIFSHVGFQDAADGASHEATTYFAATSAIPHTVVIACSCSDEAEALMHQAIKRIAHARERGGDGESVIFFVGRENYPCIWRTTRAMNGARRKSWPWRGRGDYRLRPAAGARRWKPGASCRNKKSRHRHQQSVRQPRGLGDHRRGGADMFRAGCHD